MILATYSAQAAAALLSSALYAAAETKQARVKREAHENKERGLHSGAELSAGGSSLSQGQRLVVNELLKVANQEKNKQEH